MASEVVWLERIFWLMAAFLVLLVVDIALLSYEIEVLKKAAGTTAKGVKSVTKAMEGM